MNKLQCEMCGSPDLVKQDGVFVCQHCGMKYSPEEAKKLMIEGTVKIDSSEEIKNLIELARRSFRAEDYYKAINYYEKALEKDPDNPEPAFFILYCNLYTTIHKNIEKFPDACKLFINGLPNIFAIIQNKYPYYDINIEYAEIIYTTCIELSKDLLCIFKQYRNELCKQYSDDSFTKIHTEYYAPKAFGVANILFMLGNCIEQYYKDDPTMHEFIATPWISAIQIINTDILGSCKKNMRKIVKMNVPEYIIKIKQYDSSYTAPKEAKCYVATAVYGSYNCPEVWTLRRYRDNTLAQTWYGRAFIKTYYAISPTLVKWFGKTEWFKKMWRGTLDKIVKKLQKNGVESSPYEDRDW